MNIFDRNIGTFTKEEQDILSSKKVFVAGCGGLGGYVIEYLTRMGVGHLVVCDKDVFDETNLNRQRFSDIYRIGAGKAKTAKEKALDINPSLKVEVKDVEITSENVLSFIDGVDIVVDALDNIKTRIILERACEEKKIPLVFGAVRGFLGQVATVNPGDRSISAIYKNSAEEEKPTVIVTTCAVTAGFETTECVKVLLNRGELSKKMLIIDLEDNSIDKVNL